MWKTHPNRHIISGDVCLNLITLHANVRMYTPPIISEQMKKKNKQIRTEHVLEQAIWHTHTQFCNTVPPFWFTGLPLPVLCRDTWRHPPRGTWYRPLWLWPARSPPVPSDIACRVFSASHSAGKLVMCLKILTIITYRCLWQQRRRRRRPVLLFKRTTFHIQVYAQAQPNLVN